MTERTVARVEKSREQAPVASPVIVSLESFAFSKPEHVSRMSLWWIPQIAVRTPAFVRRLLAAHQTAVRACVMMRPAFVRTSLGREIAVRAPIAGKTKYVI